MKILIPFKTPTINHLYYHRGNIKVLTTEARRLREKIESLVEPDNSLKEKKLQIELKIFENWHNKKDGAVKKKDISNREKFLVDSIFKALELDDKYIFKHTMIKEQSEKEYVIVSIEELE